MAWSKAEIKAFSIAFSKGWLGFEDMFGRIVVWFEIYRI
jgi:hypothetical protein